MSGAEFVPFSLTPLLIGCLAAVACALYGGSPDYWVRPGPQVPTEMNQQRMEIVNQALRTHRGHLSDPLEALRCLGGREIAAMAGAIAGARSHSIPVILDGFICTAAALVLDRAAPGSLDHAVAGHVSAETAHAPMLDAIGKSPLLSLNLRLGEGSGAALAIGVMKGAIACHSGMATFAEAGVSDG